MAKPKNIIFLLITIALARCASIPSPVSITPSPSIAESESTLSIALTPLGTDSHIAGTPSPRFSATPTLSTANYLTTTPVVKVKQQCLEVETSLRPNAISGGRIILSNVFNLLVLDSQDKEIRPWTSATTNEVADATVSPDGRWLAYIRDSYDQEGHLIDSKLSLLGADSQQQSAIPWGKDWAAISGWLDNERLVIVPLNRPKGTIIVINPFTEQQQELPPFFPDVYDTSPSALWGDTITVYDSSLTRVAYLRNAPTRGAGIVLWDLQNSKELWHLNHSETIRNRPEWSPDGGQLAVAAPTNMKWYHYELLSVRRDGQATQLTNLAATYPVAAIGNFKWSPNGQYIAFWLDSRQAPEQDYKGEHLLVLDMTTLQMTDYCVIGNVLGVAAPPRWSPNSQQLIVENYYEANTSRVILVDIVQNFAVQVAENLSPVGWMTTTP